MFYSAIKVNCKIITIKINLGNFKENLSSRFWFRYTNIAMAKYILNNFSIEFHNKAVFGPRVKIMNFK